MKELNTDRLKLRKLNINDIDDIYEWTSDEEVTRYVTWYKHENKAETKAFLENLLNKYNRENTYIFGIELKENSKLIGMIDVVSFEEDTAAIGYSMNRKFWNNGYMSEALGKVKEHLFNEGIKKIEISAMKENIGSNRVIQKNGFKFLREELREVKKKNIMVNLNIYEINNPLLE